MGKVRNILQAKGNQVFSVEPTTTVYKAIEKEAQAAADLAIALAKGEEPTGADAKVDNNTKEVPSVLLEPVSVTKDNIAEYTANPDFPKVEDICAGDLAAKCKELGLE